ncbi:uncharacterized protein synm.S [Xenopus laevis]|uniref:Uncharacterized protein synm.S n=1 Tax=Xenopus laevis TaxID=8355 RepID=A0A8J1MPH1_XENLA|nr:uncharacterized protein synm.S [Xenopus laevis]
MLSMRRTFGDEKAELRELNSRLDQYLSRVRQLEAENKLLVGEIQTLRVERGREWAHGYEAEIAELRRKVEELTVQKCEAEIQRENLWQELQSLQELWDQVRAMRLRIDQQLVQYNQDLQQARKGQAALEELYNRLLQECHMLRGSQHEELVLLRERALTVPMTIAMQETVHPRLSMQDVQSFSLELSESWKETFLLYLKKIEELESYVILSEQSRQEAEEEARAQGVKVVELRREHEELMRMRKMLEKELLRMKEKYMLEMEEYQIIIEELEQEKQTVTVTITDRLQDYHELMKLKTGLSLEVATYRALLEAESQKGTFTWIDQSVKNRPAGYITTYFDQPQRYSGIKRGEEKKDLPLSRTSKDIRTTSISSNIHRFQPPKVPQMRINTQPIDIGKTSRFYTSPDKSSRWDKHFYPRYEFIRNKDISKNINPPDHSIRSRSSIHSGSVNQQISQEQVNYSKPSIITKPQPAEIHKYQINTTFESKLNESRLLNTFESKLLDGKKLVDERKTTKSIGGEKSGLEFNMPIIEQKEAKSVVTSVTESTENNDTIESKIQEPPVKKERKKSEQAQKRREEFESKEDADRNIAQGETLEASHSVQKKNIYIFRGKPEIEEAVLEIPMQYEVSKREENQFKNSMEGTGETEITINTELTYVDTIEPKIPEPPVKKERKKSEQAQKRREGLESKEDADRNIAQGETLDASHSVQNKFFYIFRGKPEIPEAVLEIPMQYEVSKREENQFKNSLEGTGETEIIMNTEQTYVDTIEPKIPEPPVKKERKKSEQSQKRREELESKDNTDRNIAQGETLDASHSVQKKNIYIFRGKPETEEAVLEIPMQYEVSKREENQYKNSLEGTGETEITINTEQTYVDTIEPKIQEPPVKKERKKSELAQKRREELESKDNADRNIAQGETLDASHSVQKKNIYIFRGKPEIAEAVLEIPMQYEVSKREENQFKNSMEGTGETEITINTEQTYVDTIEPKIQEPSVKKERKNSEQAQKRREELESEEDADRNIAQGETLDASHSVQKKNIYIFRGKPEIPEAVLEIPMQYEVSKREENQFKNSMEGTEETEIIMNTEQTYVDTIETKIQEPPVKKERKKIEQAQQKREELESKENTDRNIAQGQTLDASHSDQKKNIYIFRGNPEIEEAVHEIPMQYEVSKREENQFKNSLEGTGETEITINTEQTFVDTIEPKIQEPSVKKERKKSEQAQKRREELESKEDADRNIAQGETLDASHSVQKKNIYIFRGKPEIPEAVLEIPMQYEVSKREENQFKNSMEGTGETEITINTEQTYVDTIEPKIQEPPVKKERKKIEKAQQKREELESKENADRNIAQGETLDASHSVQKKNIYIFRGKPEIEEAVLEIPMQYEVSKREENQYKDSMEGTGETEITINTEQTYVDTIEPKIQEPPVKKERKKSEQAQKRREELESEEDADGNIAQGETLDASHSVQKNFFYIFRGKPEIPEAVLEIPMQYEVSKREENQFKNSLEGTGETEITINTEQTYVDTIEPKIQEPPVKKERKKSEQAQKRREELESKEDADRNIAHKETLDASHSVQKKNIYIFRGKPEIKEAVLEIPMQYEVSKREENQFKNSLEGTGETEITINTEQTYVDTIEPKIQEPSVKKERKKSEQAQKRKEELEGEEDADRNIAQGETLDASHSVQKKNIYIFRGKPEIEEAVLEIPMQYEVSKREENQFKNNMEGTGETEITINTEQTYVDTIEPKIPEPPVKKERKKSEQARKIREELESKDDADRNIAQGETLEASHSVQKKNIYIFRGKPEIPEAVLEIPMQYEVSTREENQFKNSMEGTKETEITINTEQTYVDTIAPKIQEPSVKKERKKSEQAQKRKEELEGEEDADRNIAQGETLDASHSVQKKNIHIFRGKPDIEEAVLEIPMQYEVSKREENQFKNSMEGTGETEITINTEQTYVDTIEPKIQEPPVKKERKKSEQARKRREELESKDDADRNIAQGETLEASHSVQKKNIYIFRGKPEIPEAVLEIPMQYEVSKREENQYKNSMEGTGETEITINTEQTYVDTIEPKIPEPPVKKERKKREQAQKRRDGLESKDDADRNIAQGETLEASHSVQKKNIYIFRGKPEIPEAVLEIPMQYEVSKREENQYKYSMEGTGETEITINTEQTYVDTIEPKIQEPPVKKERKKSKQAQKRREELESKEDADRNLAQGETLEASHSVQKKNIYIFRGKPQIPEAVLEIPMQYEVSKREGNQFKNSLEGTGETEVIMNTEQTYVDTIEPKIQEPPVKKERKKREQAQKRREELESKEEADRNIAQGETLDASHSVQKKNIYIFRGKPEIEETVLEIPMQYEVSKREENQFKNSMEGKGETEITINTEQTYVDTIEPKIPEPPVKKERKKSEQARKRREELESKDDADRNIAQGETLEASHSVQKKNIYIFRGKPEIPEAVLEIPMQYEVSKIEENQFKNSLEGKGETEIIMNTEQTYVDTIEPKIQEPPVKKERKKIEQAQKRRDGLESKDDADRNIAQGETLDASHSVQKKNIYIFRGKPEIPEAVLEIPMQYEVSKREENQYKYSMEGTGETEITINTEQTYVDTIEPKIEEPSVKKERKKSEQAQKRREELESEEDADRNIAPGETLEASHSVQKKNIYIFRGKPEIEEAVLEIPMQYEVSKREENQFKNSLEGKGETEIIMNTEQTYVDTIEPKIQEPPVKKERKKREQAQKRREELESKEEVDRNIAQGETLDASHSVQKKNIYIFRGKPEIPEAVLEIPMQYEVSKREENQYKYSMEGTGETEITINTEQTYVDTIEPKIQEPPFKKERKKSEQAQKRREELESKENADRNIAQGETLEASHSVQKKNIYIYRGKPEIAEAVLEIPMQYEVSKGEENQSKNSIEGTGETEITINTEQTYVDTIEPNIQEPSVKKERKKSEQAKKRREELESEEDADRNIAQGETLDASHSVQKKNIYIFRGKPEIAEAVLEIPMQYEVSKREENQYKYSMECTGETEIIMNTEQTYVDKQAHHRNIEPHTSLDKGAEPVKTGESEEDITSAEDLTKNSVVEGIIKHFGQSSGLDDANVTYVEKKEQASDGSVKTKIFVETKTKEEVDFLDEPDLTDLWNSSSYQRIQEGVARAATNAVEDEQKQKETETIIGEGKGVDDWIKIMIQNELKVRSGVSFNVEIIEESTGAFVTEKTDFITPFHVEEVEDNIQATESACFYDKPQDPVKADDLQSETQVQRHAEEVTEGGDEDEETNYFVSVPDDIPLVQDEDQETLRGQIHIEDSHVKYSWQDAFLQGSQGQKALSEFIRYAGSNESETIVHDILDDDKEHRIESQQQPKTETFVIEKEIKIPHEFQSSIIGLFSKDIKHPQQQLKGTLECLQGSLPENIVVELSSLAEEQKAQDSSLAIDIKKVEQPTDTSMVTIVAEINLSQTVDADKLDTQGLLGDSMSEEVVATLLEKTKGEYSIFMNESATKSGYHLTSEIDNEGATSISKDNTDNATNGSFSTKVKLLHKQISTESRFIKHIQLETYEQATEENTSPISTNRSIHHIKFEPREMTFDEKNISEGPMSDIVELDISKGAEESADYSRPIRHITLSPTETYTVEQIVFEGPIFKTVSSGGSTEDFAFGELPKDSSSHKNVHDNIVEIEDSRTQKSNNESIYQTETITGGIKTIKHYILNPRDTGMAKGIIIDGAMPKVQLHQKTDSLEGNIMPTEHRFGSQKIQVATQVKHQGFVSEPYKVADSGKLVEEEENSNVNTLVHHIKLSPNKEQIVFEGPISSNVHISRQEGSSQMEVENRSIKHIILGAKKAQTSESLIFEGPVSESYVFEGPISSNVHINSQEGSSQMEVENRSITDIILGAKEAKTSESVIFEGPVSESCESWDLSPSGDSSESEGSIKHIKLGPTEKSFTFQMDITQIATKHNGQGDVQGREIVITSSNFERLPGTSQSYSELTDDLEVSESGYGEEDTSGISQDVAEIQTHKLSFKETPAFEKTVHVQRIAQQSSLVSDDNKVVIVYLDEEEEPDQDYLQRSF